jgi:hypothetical protein
LFILGGCGAYSYDFRGQDRGQIDVSAVGRLLEFLFFQGFSLVQILGVHGGAKVGLVYLTVENEFIPFLVLHQDIGISHYHKQRLASS